MKHVLLAGLAGMLLAGCSSMRQLDDDAPGPSGEESVVILGMHDAEDQVFIFPGTVGADGSFVTDPMRMATVAGKPRNGYLVGKARAGDVIAITTVRFDAHPGKFSGTEEFRFCKGEKTMVFKVPQGKVAYLGSVEYRFVDRNMNIHYTVELDQAQRYIDSTFPALKGKVEHIAPDFRTLGGPCFPKTYIPIYITR